MAAIAGLSVPSQAWKRLYEIYGNREAAIMTAMGRLRGFQHSKTPACDQIIDLVRAVQRCKTILENLGAMHEFHADRETTADIVHLLPADSEARWYHRKPPRDETQTQKSMYLLGWLEEERLAAVVLHLDNITRQPKITGPSQVKWGTKTDPGGSSQLSMDQGLYVGAHLAQQNGGSSGVPEVKPPLNPSRSDSQPSPMGPVMTGEQANTITMQRTASLIERKLDKCPLCKSQHHFEKTWAQVVPTKKTRMISTHLSSCQRFVAMTPADQVKTVVDQGACAHCSAWDHRCHKAQGGGNAGEPKCGL